MEAILPVEKKAAWMRKRKKRAIRQSERVRGRYGEIVELLAGLGVGGGSGEEVSVVDLS